MRPHDLPSVQQLARNKPHGHKMRYLAGCRCRKCRNGNKKYERELKRKRALYGPNDLVPVHRVRSFLQDMQTVGIGYMTIAKHVGVAKTPLGEILWPGKSGRTHIRRRTENAVLSYRPTLDTMPLMLKIPAGETVARIEQLTRWGIPRALISTDGLGLKTPAIQIHAMKKGPSVVEVFTAKRIRDYFAKVAEIREIWRNWRGEIPPAHFVYWKPGRTGNYLKDLELRPFAANYNYHNLYPQELKDAIRAQNKLRKSCQELRKNHNAKEFARRSPQSSVRNA